MSQAALNRKIIFIGNGGGAAISSHMAIDFWKMAALRQFLLMMVRSTCLGNDFAYKYVFESQLKCLLIRRYSYGYKQLRQIREYTALRAGIKLKGCSVVYLRF